MGKGLLATGDFVLLLTDGYIPECRISNLCLGTKHRRKNVPVRSIRLFHIHIMCNLIS